MSLVVAMLLDAAFGEPRWVWSRVPHPAVLIGRGIGWADSQFNSGANRRLKGAAVLVAICVAAVVVGYVVSVLPLGWLWQALLAAILLAQRSLADHVGAVADALRLSTHDARLEVAKIVGRDTRDMGNPEIARAAIESAAENFSDGVVAPVFWFLVAGLPGILLYKAVNTADSMIGYRTERHEEFGWASARFDDLLNLIPARLTAIMVVTGQGLWAAWPNIVRDARQHRSPNAGWPEAAFARALDVALAGPRSYDGKTRDYPFVNKSGAHEIGANEVANSTRLLWRYWGALFALAIVVAIF